MPLLEGEAALHGIFFLFFSMFLYFCFVFFPRGRDLQAGREAQTRSTKSGKKRQLEKQEAERETGRYGNHIIWSANTMVRNHATPIT